MSESDESPIRQVIGAVAGGLPGGVLFRQVKVDRAALRRAVSAAHSAADRLEEQAAKARIGLDGAAHKYPGMASSAVLTAVAESFRERQVKVVADVAGFGSLVGRITDSYDCAEEGASAILQKFLDGL